MKILGRARKQTAMGGGADGVVTRSPLAVGGGGGRWGQCRCGEKLKKKKEVVE
jgi:hypothetical protein